MCDASPDTPTEYTSPNTDRHQLLNPSTTDAGFASAIHTDPALRVGPDAMRTIVSIVHAVPPILRVFWGVFSYAAHPLFALIDEQISLPQIFQG